MGCIRGNNPQPTCFTAAALAQLPRTSLTVWERDGTRIIYEWRWGNVQRLWFKSVYEQARTAG